MIAERVETPKDWWCLCSAMCCIRVNDDIRKCMLRRFARLEMEEFARCDSDQDWIAPEDIDDDVSSSCDDDEPLTSSSEDERTTTSSSDDDNNAPFISSDDDDDDDDDVVHYFSGD